MDEEAAIEEQLRRSVRPDTEDVPKHVLHCLERDQADGVVQEMHRHICEHHQAGNEPQTPDHRSTFWRCRRIANLQLPAPRFLCLGRRRQASLRSLGCKASPSAEHMFYVRRAALPNAVLITIGSRRGAFHAGLGFTGMISAGDRQGFGGSAISVRSPAGPLKSFDLVMNYRTKTQWPRHLA